MQIWSGERQLQYPYQVEVETLQIDEIAQGERVISKKKKKRPELILGTPTIK